MGLLLLEIMADARVPLHEIVADLQAQYGPTCYDRTDYTLKAPVPKREMVRRLEAVAPGTLAGETVRDVLTFDGIKFILADDSWLLIRPSGTEPVLRVYAEAHDADQVRALLDAGRVDRRADRGCSRPASESSGVRWGRPRSALDLLVARSVLRPYNDPICAPILLDAIPAAPPLAPRKEEGETAAWFKSRPPCGEGFVEWGYLPSPSPFSARSSPRPARRGTRVDRPHRQEPASAPQAAPPADPLVQCRDHRRPLPAHRSPQRPRRSRRATVHSSAATSSSVPSNVPSTPQRPGLL